MQFVKETLSLPYGSNAYNVLIFLYQVDIKKNYNLAIFSICLAYAQHAW